MSAGTAVTFNSSMSPVPAVLLPRIRFVFMFCILEKVTVSAGIVVAKDPVPLPVTSPVRVIVWSPVFVPLLVPEKVPD
jgi:hypothetical protein